MPEQITKSIVKRCDVISRDNNLIYKNGVKVYNQRMSALKKLARLHFDLSQKKWIWFPFYFLKPKCDEFIEHKTVLKMSICFGAYFYLFYLLRNLAFHGSFVFEPDRLGIFVLAFMIWFETVTRPLWNFWVKSERVS